MSSAHKKFDLASNLAAYGSGHFLIDAICAAMLAARSLDGTIPISIAFDLFVLYNILAFGLQAPLGFWLDKWRKPRHAAAAGAVLTALAIPLSSYSILAAVGLAGIGNALFHVGGGTIALNLAPRKAWAVGLQVAPGALGLFAGAWAAKNGWPLMAFGLAAMGIAFIIFRLPAPKIDYHADKKRMPSAEKKRAPPAALLLLLLFLLAIGIRSSVGLSIVFPWKAEPLLGLALALAVAGGKAAGGVLADRFGWAGVGAGALALSAPLLTFGSGIPFFGLAGILLFNMTMPITLVATARLLPGRPGLAFGLTCLALLAGALCVFYGGTTAWSAPLILAVLIGITALALYGGLRELETTARPN